MATTILALLSATAAAVIAAMLWNIHNVRTWCWSEQGVSTGVQGTIQRALFGKKVHFAWTCECVGELLGDPASGDGELRKVIVAVAGDTHYRKTTLFENSETCTPITLNKSYWWPPNRYPYVDLTFKNQTGATPSVHIALTPEKAALFLLNLQAQYRNCCF